MSCIFLNNRVDIESFNKETVTTIDDTTITVSIGIKDFYKVTAIFEGDNVYDCTGLNSYYRTNRKLKYDIGASFKEENSSNLTTVGFKSVKDFDKFSGSFYKDYQEYILATVNAYLFEKYFNEGIRYNNVNVNLIIILGYRPILFMKYQFEDCIGKIFKSVSSAYGKDVNIKVNNLNFGYHKDILPQDFSKDFNQECNESVAMLTSQGILPMSFENIFTFLDKGVSISDGVETKDKAKTTAKEWFKIIESQIDSEDFYYKYSNLYKDLKNIRKEFND